MHDDHPLATTICSTPLGPLLLAAGPKGLCGAWFEGQKHWPSDAAGWTADPAHALLREAQAQLAAYFEDRLATFDLPLAPRRGTPFQQAVWQALCAIPRGGTLSYARLAAQVGRPAAVRAVGAAVGRNPLSIFVPCHRVIGSAGALTGYAGGLPRKTALLRLEGALR